MKVKDRIAMISQVAQELAAHPLISHLDHVSIALDADSRSAVAPEAWVLLRSSARVWGRDRCQVIPNIRMSDDPDEWRYVIARAYLHNTLGHLNLDISVHPSRLAAAAVIADRFVVNFGIGVRPAGMVIAADGFPDGGEAELASWIRDTGALSQALQLSLHPGQLRAWAAPQKKTQVVEDGMARLARGIRAAAQEAIQSITTRDDENFSRLSTEVRQARAAIIADYPLLAASVAGFTIVENAEICRAQQIPVAAVSASERTIYFNPDAKLSLQQTIFVFAHEVLHPALKHHLRRGNRDPVLWNWACDFYINDLLIQLAVGEPPEQHGYAFDIALRGLSAEEIYDRLVRDIRLKKELLKRKGWASGGDMSIDRAPAGFWRSEEGITLDELARRSLYEGMQSHIQRRLGRGWLPGHLVEEIKALMEPPVPWDVPLGRWLDEFIRSPERRRTFARASRRPPDDPEIVKPGWFMPEERKEGRTFGVVLDTSGSMDSTLLKRAIGAIISYAISRDVEAVRLVQCDAAPVDCGYISPSDLAEEIKIYGRGGTVLRPAVDMFEAFEDFPKDAPILLITDAGIDSFTVRREHAWLLPKGVTLPFKDSSPRFYFE